MNETSPFDDLEGLVLSIEKLGSKQDTVRLEKLVEVAGSRSFGPILFVCGLIALSPLSGIPGMPSTVAVMVILVASQLLIGRKHFWLPKCILGLKLPGEKIERGMKMIKRPAEFMDRILQPRLSFCTGRTGMVVIAVFCIMVALTMPPLELVPFLATTAGFILTLMGLSLMTGDGLVAIIGIVTGTCIGVVLYTVAT